MLLDILGTVTSLLSTYYFIRLDNKAWLMTLLATCFNSVLYWQNGIYADMLLELFYFLSTCYGWYLWKKPTEPLGNIRKLSKKQWTLLLIAIMGCFILFSILLTTFTPSNVVLLDALTTSLSLAAQWLMCHKALATWFFWLVTDSIYAYMYFQKQLPFHCLLMIVYMGMAIIGYLTWTKQKRIDQSFGLKLHQA
ncbi:MULTISPECIES: nicotinamide riboside transporter PnuC [Legionella]|uniref:Nicotinamide riboside transporter PnuC n=1 Tax=Legionella drozanskii LLAP-1 TaxID=1212489 RepID=A0A0W0SQH0_9GAMM|nr:MULTISPECIES: nicotinamide riboside transporter PnuC [Legionella]KTC85658.1 Nicotinamide mononucleotide transporter [Legionella drozanskii LLAP-1]PJE15360.1 MAG: nicotinamide mononucleotide transporter [Legionella sp.]